MECLVCRGNNVQKKANWNENYAIMFCENCKVLFSNPMPTERQLNDYYQGFLFATVPKERIKKNIAVKMKLLKKYFSVENNTKKSFLDYGAGVGFTYKAAENLGFESFYFEIDEQAKNYAKKFLNLKNEQMVENIRKWDKKVDYIISDNVIEHLIEPISFLKEIKFTLNKHSKAVIITPTARNTEFFFHKKIKLYVDKIRNNNNVGILNAYFKRLWHCDPPRHLYSFSKKSLQIMAKSAGFKESEISVTEERLPMLRHYLIHYIGESKRFTKETITMKTGFLTFFKLIYLIGFIIPLHLFVLLILHEILCRLRILSFGGLILTLERKN